MIDARMVRFHYYVPGHNKPDTPELEFLTRDAFCVIREVLEACNITGKQVEFEMDGFELKITFFPIQPFGLSVDDVANLAKRLDKQFDILSLHFDKGIIPGKTCGAYILFRQKE